MYRLYVEVLARHTPEGKVVPLSIVWEDGRQFSVDRILDTRRCVSLKVGGAGIRYTCMICGKSRYLFYEDERWFVEARDEKEK